MRRIVGFPGVTFLIALTGCGGGGATDTPTDVPIAANGASQSVGPSGGTLFAAGVTLTVPPGALASATTITITRTDEAIPAGYVGYSPVWRFAPDGLTFAVPATVQVSFTGDAARAGLYWSRTDRTGYDRLAGAVVGGAVVAAVSHFSAGFVGTEASDAGATDVPPSIDVPPSDVPPSDVPPSDAPDATVPIDATAPVDATTPTDAAAPVDGGPSSRAPRPLAPASGSVVARRPTLRWALGAGTDGAHVDLCRDRALTIGCVALDAVGTSATPSADLAAGTWFWRLRDRTGGVPGTAVSVVWHFRVGAAAAPTDRAPLPGFDVNADGFDDLAVSDPVGSAVYLYAGSATGLPAASTATLGGSLGDRFGAALASAGDVNGDGYSDLLASANGGARVFLGGPTGLAPSAAQTLAGADRFVALGDVDRDGYGDVLVGAATATVYYGSAGGLATRAGVLSCSVAGGCGGIVGGAGDVNGDGFADALMGASAGAVELHLGSALGLAPTAAVTLTDPFKGDGGGFTGAAGLGDVNGDGYGDVAATTVLTAPGAAVYLGSAAGLTNVASITVDSQRAPRFGTHAGDVNGDGYDDLAMPAEGAIYTRLGSATGVRLHPTITSAPAGQSTDHVTAGDYNGDGYSDLVANSLASIGRTEVPVFAGGPSGSATTASIRLRSPVTLEGFGSVFAVENYFAPGIAPYASVATRDAAYTCRHISGPFEEGCLLWPHVPNARFGAAMATPVDLNGDHVGEVLVGAPGANAVYAFTRVPDSSTPPPSPVTLVATIAGPAGAVGFGAAVAGAVDVNHDGTLDAIVGAPDAARAYVYLGATGPTPTPITLAGAAGSHFGRLVESVWDLNGDAYDDVAVGSDGRVDVFLGTATGVSTTAAVSLTGPAGSRFGEAVSTAGDVNGDGLKDVVVGAPGAAAAYVYYGHATHLPTAPSVTLTGPVGSEFGAAVAYGGDLNGAGGDDLVIGAPGAAVAYVYLGSRTGLATTPAGSFAGAAGSRFGARIARDGQNAHSALGIVYVGSPGNQEVSQCAYTCEGVRQPICTYSRTVVWSGSFHVRSFGPFGTSVASQ